MLTVERNKGSKSGNAVSHHLAVKGQALHRIAVVCVYVTVSPIWQLCSWV